MGRSAADWFGVPADPLLAATLIVRDEAAQLAECLSGLVRLADLVDEVVVYDTGSVDETPQIASSLGARVLLGHWDGDFARARNAALKLTRAEWVLVLDADERVAEPADPAALRALLATTGADVLTVWVRNLQPEELGGSYRHPGPRLLRREHVRYVGRVHEQPISTRRTGLDSCRPELLSLDHLGYADVAAVRAKAQRNAAIAAAELERLRLRPDVDRERLGRVLLDLGRSLVLCERRQEAVDAFETLRALFPGTRRALEGTDALARLLLGAGLDEAVLVLAEELRAGGVDGRYCDWLRAQALAQLGDPQQALRLLRGVDLLLDSCGREFDLGQVLETRALVAMLCGERDEAVECLTEAMVRYGRVAGRAELLAQLTSNHP